MSHAVRMFAQDNNGKLWPDWLSYSTLSASSDSLEYGYENIMWIYVLQGYWHNPKMLFCPSAMNVASIDGDTPNPPAVFREWGHTNWAWYTYWAPPLKATGKPCMSSFGVNDFASTLFRLDPTQQANADKQYWGSLNQENADQIPLLFDSAWYSVAPMDASKPNPNPLSKYHWPDTFGPITLPRHNGGINMLFMDGSLRRVGIKELWTLKWSKTFNTQNRYTTPDYRWPDWIEALPR